MPGPHNHVLKEASVIWESPFRPTPGDLAHSPAFLHVQESRVSWKTAPIFSVLVPETKNAGQIVRADS